jgi:hypothetical protein
MSLFAQHCIDDKQMGGRLNDLELAAARQKGAARVLTMFGSGIGALLGWLFERLYTAGHH